MSTHLVRRIRRYKRSYSPQPAPRIALTRAIATACLVLLAFAFAGCRGKGEKGERDEAAKEGGKQTSAKVSADGSIQLSAQQAQANGIQTATPREELLAPAINVVGRVQAQPGRESEVFSPFAGRLIAAGSGPPGTGTAVKQGQVLAELEQLLTAPERTQYASQVTQLDAAATQAQQEVDLRRVELDRAKQLYDGGAIPLKQVQTAEFNLRQAESRFQSALTAAAEFRSLLSAQGSGPRRVSIVAPISGTVVTSDLTPGMQVDPAKSLMKIVDLSTVWVEAAVPEAQLGVTRQSGRAEVTTPAAPGRIYQAALVTVGPAVDLASRTAAVIYRVTNSDSALKLDMTAEVRIPTGPRTPVLLVPASAVLYGAGQAMLFVERAPGSYQRRTITTGETRGPDVVVRSGLNPGEKVVSAGAEALRSELLKGTISTEER